MPIKVVAKISGFVHENIETVMKPVASRCSSSSSSSLVSIVATAHAACRFAAATLLAVSLSASISEAGTLTSWRGSVNNNWANGSSWSPSNLNTTGTFSLVMGGTNRTATNNNVGVVKIDSLSFTNNGSAGRTSAFTISGSAIQFVDAAVTTTAASTAITDLIQSAVINSGTTTITTGSSHNITFSAPVSGGSFVKSGVGSVQFTNTFASDLSINQGAVSFNSTSAPGLDGRVVTLSNLGGGAGGNLVFTGVSGTSTAQIRINGNGSGIVSAIQSSNITFSAPVFNVASTALSGTLSLLGGSTNPATATILGTIQDNAAPLSVHIGEGNAWVLKGINTYTGLTTVGPNAKLLVDGGIGSGGVSSTGFVGGNGLISGGLAMSGSGQLAPGGSSSGSGLITDSIGMLTVLGPVSLGSNVTSQFTISGLTAGTDYDQLYGSSSIAYGGILSLTLTGSQSYAKDTTFNLFKDFSTRTGNFSSVTLAATGTPYDGLVFTNMGGGIWETGTTGFPLGSGFRFDESTGDLVVVPEPSTFVLAGLGAAMAGVQFWRRRRVAKA